MRKTVCVDLDGVLADYSAGWQGCDVIGDPIPGAVEFTRALSEFADVVIYTTRCCVAPFEGAGRDGKTADDLVALVRAWLDRHGFAYRSIFAGQGKPIAAAYIDDRAVACCPQDDGSPDTFDVALVRASELCGVVVDRLPIRPDASAARVRLVVEFAVAADAQPNDVLRHLSRTLRFVREHAGPGVVPLDGCVTIRDPVEPPP